MLAVFASAKDKFKVERAEPVEYSGKTYQAWGVSMNHQGEGGSFKYTVLLDDNHLPAVIALGRSSITEYSDWNKPLAIEAPANALPYPEHPQSAAPPHAMPKSIH